MLEYIWNIPKYISKSLYEIKIRTVQSIDTEFRIDVYRNLGKVLVTFWKNSFSWKDKTKSITKSDQTVKQIYVFVDFIFILFTILKYIMCGFF